MTRKTRIADLPDFDMARQLESDEDIAAYVTMVIEEGDAAELAHALGIAAKARGMSEISQAAGLTREALYKALRPNAKPRFDTINKVCTALGVQLIARVKKVKPL
ncbi:MAG: putative addiction module antidote protein [Deltaproteobacteria bacterium]|jgi:probable addiction module antidote protein|nr:putative addiction module antidote protein [Deltaproteobacteria bacterium]MBT4639004.1 putative addiction module antidote protein [Deltaproteobacteria bacterium]MBT6501493.1 putative addiction module antidote protein [Deltaproteobacteria bacterium]MBT7153372.1 putative addiction module antidote protein [Deltaproteobacteria bacterium]MBT7715743.1 putative addiction module antidote protein [Deltaproteobacteria bacterium]